MKSKRMLNLLLTLSLLVGALSSPLLTSADRPVPAQSPTDVAYQAAQGPSRRPSPPLSLAERAVSEPLALELSASPSRESRAPTVPSQVLADVDLILDDGTNENNVGIGGTWEFLWLNRFTPDPGDYPFELFEIQVYFEGGTNLSPGDDIILVVYENTSGNADPAVGSNWLASFSTTVQAVDAWNVYDLSATPVTFTGPGDVLIGVITMETPGTDYFPAAIDQTATQGRSWAGLWLASPPPAPPTLPPDDTWGLIDSFGYPGNWLIRGYARYPADGWLEGYVMDSETGDVGPTCTDAVVHIEPSGQDILAGADGYYWTALVSGTHTLSATAPGFSLETAVVDITEDMTTTRNFNLWRPVITVTPGSLVSYTAYISQETTYSLTLVNDGHLSSTFEVTTGVPGAYPDVNFEGIPSTGVYPPDTDGQVGPHHYVQIVNAFSTGAWVRVWDKGGNQLYDFGLSDLWPAGDRCYTDPGGDPVVLYDQLADRWLLTQFTNPASGPYNECIAVSQGTTPTDDPADWYLYTIDAHATLFNDYPKLGVWPDAYYMMAHQFGSDPQCDLVSGWCGSGFWAFDRASMLAGTAPQAPAHIDCITPDNYCVYHDVGGDNMNYGGMLPSNLMGDTEPPLGSPNYFVEVDPAGWVYPFDALTIWEVSPNFGTGLNVTQVNTLTVSAFTRPVCANIYERCIHQPESAPQLEAIGERFMMHAWYRNELDSRGYEVIVANHTVDAGGNRAGIVWYELRKDAGTPDWYVYQDGLYHPDDDHRWMGSIAMDAVGNMALGYSVSSETTYPSIRYATRQPGDPLNWIGNETEIIAGSGVQTGPDARWGDYSAISVDPVNDCTFWYTQEYVETSGPVNWQTRVASFDVPGCFPSTDWFWVDTISGTVPATSTVEVGVTFHCTATGDYTGTIIVQHDDPCQVDPIEVPIVLHCLEPPEPAWDKEVWINDEGPYGPGDGPFTGLLVSDTIVIADRVWVTSTAPVTFSLLEEWSESLELLDYELPPGSLQIPGIDVVTDTGVLTWTVSDLPGDSSYVLTKTFQVVGGDWSHDYITETLWVEDAETQLDEQVVAFEHAVTYELTVATDGTGSGTVEPSVGAHSYISGTTVWLTATADPGSEFVAWSGGLTGNPTSIVMDSDKTVTATFDLLPGTYYTLAVATDGTGSGTVEPSVGAHSYISGTTVWLTATANPGSEFVGWSGGMTANPMAVLMDSDKTVTATFNLLAPVYYTLTVATDGTGSGTVEPPEGTHTYLSGTTVWLTATTGLNSEFVGWSGGLMGNPISIVMDSDKTVTATFDLLPGDYYTLTVTTDGTGLGTVAASVPGVSPYTNILSGTTVWLTATAGLNSEFVGWSGHASGSVNPVSVLMNSDKAVIATFDLVFHIYLPLVLRGG